MSYSMNLNAASMAQSALRNTISKNLQQSVPLSNSAPLTATVPQAHVLPRLDLGCCNENSKLNFLA